MSACFGFLIVTILRGMSPPIHAAGQAQSADSAQADEAHARAACGVCHALPPPDILPRGAWRDEFVRMYFIRENRLPPIGPAGALQPRRPAARPGRGAAVLHEPRARAPAAAGKLAGARRVAPSVHAPDHDHAGHAGHAGGVERSPGGSRRRQAPRSARHRHAAGSRLHRPPRQARQRADRRREHSASLARHGDRRGQGRRPRSARRRSRHLLPRGSQQGRPRSGCAASAAASSAPSGWTAGRASPASTPPTSTATASPIWRSRPSAGGRPARSRSWRTRPPSRRSRRSSPTSSIRAPAAST